MSEEIEKRIDQLSLEVRDLDIRVKEIESSAALCIPLSRDPEVTGDMIRDGSRLSRILCCSDNTKEANTAQNTGNPGKIDDLHVKLTAQNAKETSK